MTESLGRAVLALETDATGLQGGLNKAEQQTQGWLGRISASFKRLSSSTIGGGLLQGLGIGGGLAAVNMLGSAVAGLSTYMSDAINDASDLAESQAKVNVVFGEGSAAIDAWADTSAEAFGQSKQQALEAAGTYGNLFQAFGIARDEATEMSMSLVELAADLASFNNTSVDDALLALRSGLSGETEPLKRYGIAINDARLRTALAAKGIENLGGTLTAQQKAVGAYALIMQDSALAQGDFARTSDGLANQQRILAAQMENVSAEVGEKLLPVMVTLINWINDTGVPVLKGFVDSLDEIGFVVGQVGDVFNPMGAVMGDFADDAAYLNQVLEDTGMAAEDLRPLFDAFNGDLAKGVQELRNWAEQGISVEQGLKTLGKDYSGMPEVVATSLRTGKPIVLSGAAEMAGAIPEAMEGAVDEATGIAADTPGELAEALLSGLHDWEDSWATMEEAATSEMEKGRRIRNNLARLASQELIDGLRSGDAARRAAAEQVRADLIRALSIDGYQYGYNVMATMARGIYAGKGILVNAAASGAAAVRSQIAIESEPKDPSSPLRGITKWGGNIVHTLVDGIKSELGTATGGAKLLADALVPAFRGPTLALENGAMASAGRMHSETGEVAGVTNQWILHVDGVPKKVGKRDEILDEYEQMMGYGDRRAHS